MMMKEGKYYEKIFRTFITISMCLLTILGLTIIDRPVLAFDEIGTYAVEEDFVISEDKTLNMGYGYVTCKVTVTYNSVGNTYTVKDVVCVQHFSFTQFGLVLHDISSSPSRGQRITNDKVIVKFKVFNRFGGVSWDYSCNLYL